MRKKIILHWADQSSQGRIKISSTGTTSPTNQPRKDPLHLYSISSSLPQFPHSQQGPPLSGLSVYNPFLIEIRVILSAKVFSLVWYIHHIGWSLDGWPWSASCSAEQEERSGGHDLFSEGSLQRCPTRCYNYASPNVPSPYFFSGSIRSLDAADGGLSIFILSGDVLWTFFTVKRRISYSTV
jgi:hypothetical protein